MKQGYGSEKDPISNCKPLAWKMHATLQESAWVANTAIISRQFANYGNHISQKTKFWASGTGTQKTESNPVKLLSGNTCNQLYNPTISKRNGFTQFAPCVVHFNPSPPRSSTPAKRQTRLALQCPAENHLAAFWSRYHPRNPVAREHFNELSRLNALSHHPPQSP